MPSNRPSPPVPPDRLLRELASRISSMERLLGNLVATESQHGARFTKLKVDLRARLTACYVAKQSLQDGDTHVVASIDELLLRIRCKVEHRKFRDLGVVDMHEVRAVNLDELSQRLLA